MIDLVCGPIVLGCRTFLDRPEPLEAVHLIG